MSAVQKAHTLAESLNLLPPLPEVAQKILTELNDEFVTGEEVAAVVGQDPGISARLVALANSAYFGLSNPVGSVDEVVNRVLGVDNVRSLALALAADHVFDTAHCQSFDTGRFWINALLMADATRRVIDGDTEATEDERTLAYQAGLCHNIGLLALAYLVPAQTHAVLTQRDSQPDTPQSLGRLLMAAIGMDHRQVTYAVAQAWQLPEATLAAYEPVPHSSSRLHCALDVARMAIAVQDEGTEPSTIAADLTAAAPTPRQRQRVEAMVQGIQD
ncbi:MAG: HDOD domain-containing protein [Lysobacterales bacterium]